MRSIPTIAALAAGALTTALLTAGPARAQFPAGRTYIIQLTSSQGSSGMGEYLVPPLKRAFDQAGLRYRPDAGAEYTASVTNAYDVGKWHGAAGGRSWLHTRTVTVGLSPAGADIDKGNRMVPHFSVSARLLTADADRVDELNCLVALATRELVARYRPRGQATIDGSACRR